MERIENLGFGDLRLIQDDEQFCFGTDAVLLAQFAAGFAEKGCTAVDLGTGNGIIPILLTNLIEGVSVTGVELQECAYKLAVRNAELNGLSDRVRFINCDVKNAVIEHPELAGSAGLIVTNPPYVRRGAGLVNDGDSLFIARQETTGTLEDFISTAASVSAPRGHFCMIHRPSRLVDIISLSRKYGMEPKHMQFVHPHEGETPNMVMVHCIKSGGPELKILDPIIVHKK